MKKIYTLSLILFSLFLKNLYGQTGVLTGWGMSVCQQFSFSICPGEIITPFNYGSQGYVCSLTVMPDVSFVNQGPAWRVAKHNWDFIASGAGAQISGVDQFSTNVNWPFTSGSVLSPSIYTNINGFNYITFAINNNAIPFTVREDNFQIQLTGTATPISVNSATICQGKTATLNVSGATNYTWSPGNLTGQSISVNHASTTVYTVTGNNGNCTFNSTSFATITILPSPTLTLTTSRSVICAKETAILSVSGANTYSWSNGSSSNTVGINPSTSTTYTVTGTGLNGCTKTNVITQNVSPCTNLIASSMVTPSGVEVYPNPNNGEFTIETLTETDVIIVNTLGQIILQKHLIEGKNKIELWGETDGIHFVRFYKNNKTIKLTNE